MVREQEVTSMQSLIGICLYCLIKQNVTLRIGTIMHGHLL